jgi:hypothetical protein
MLIQSNTRSARATAARTLCALLATSALCLPLRAQGATIADHFGVNVHMDAKSTHYAQYADTYNKAVWVGATHLREAAPSAGDTYTLNAMLAGCAQGLSWTLIVMSDPAPLWSNIDKIAAQPGCLHALEGPNEVNVTPPAYGALRGYPAGVAIQKALYAKAKADPLTAAVPVYSLTVATGGATAALGNLSAYSDAANSHDYMSQVYPPNCCIMTMARASLNFAPGRPMVITESGYRTMPNTGNAADQTTQNRLLLYTLLDTLTASVSDVTMYQLLDALPDPTNASMESHWGLFNGAYNPESIKSSGYGFHFTMALIGSSTISASGGTALQKAPASTHTLTSVGANGTVFTTVWAEPVLWNNTTHKANELYTTNATMTLGSTYSSVKVYDVVTNGDTPIATYSNVSSVALPIAADPLIIAMQK